MPSGEETLNLAPHKFPLTSLWCEWKNLPTYLWRHLCSKQNDLEQHEISGIDSSNNSANSHDYDYGYDYDGDDEVEDEDEDEDDAHDDG